MAGLAGVPGSRTGESESAGFFGTTQPTTSQVLAAQTTFNLYAQLATGIVYPGSRIRFSDITDGASCTYLLGEKHMVQECYEGRASPFPTSASARITAIMSSP